MEGEPNQKKRTRKNKNLCHWICPTAARVPVWHRNVAALTHRCVDLSQSSLHQTHTSHKAKTIFDHPVNVRTSVDYSSTLPLQLTKENELASKFCVQRATRRQNKKGRVFYFQPSHPLNEWAAKRLPCWPPWNGVTPTKHLVKTQIRNFSSFSSSFIHSFTSPMRWSQTAVRPTHTGRPVPGWRRNFARRHQKTAAGQDKR